MMTSCFDHTEIEDWRGVLSSLPFLSRRFLVKSLPFGQGLMWNLFFLEHCSSTKRFRGTDRIWWIFLCEKSWPLYLEPPSIFLTLLCCNLCYCHFLSILFFILPWPEFHSFCHLYWALLQLGFCLGQVWYPVRLTFGHAYFASSAKLQLWCYIIWADSPHSPFVSYGYILPYEVLEVYWCTFDVGCCCSLSEGVLFFPWEKWQEWWIN